MVGAFFVFGGNRWYGVGISLFHRRGVGWRCSGSTFLKLSEGFTKLWAVCMGGRRHDRQLLFPVSGHEDAAHGHRLRHLDGYRRPGRRHRGHSGFPGACHCPAAYFRGAAARRYRRAEAHHTSKSRRGSFLCFAFGRLQRNTAAQSRSTTVSAQPATAPGSLRRSTAAYTPPRRPGRAGVDMLGENVGALHTAQVTQNTAAHAGKHTHQQRQEHIAAQAGTDGYRRPVDGEMPRPMESATSSSASQFR